VPRRLLAAIFACVAIYGLTVGLTNPLLSLILESRGTSRTLIGLNAAMPAFGTFLVAPFIPRLLAWFRAKRFLQCCLFADLLLYLMFPIFDHLYAWFCIRLVMGAATNGLLTISETWVNEIIHDGVRGRVIGGYNMMLAASIALGPLVIPVTGINGSLPFLIGASFIFIASLPLFWLGSNTLHFDGKSSFTIASFYLLAPTLALAALLFSWKEIAGSALLPVYGVRNGMDPATAAAMLTILGMGGVCLTYPIGWLADRMDRNMLLIICGVAAVCGALLLPVAIDEVMLLWPLLFLWGGAFTGIYTLTLTIIGERFRGMELAVANIAIGVIWGIGSLTGPPITGLAMDIWDPSGFPGAFAVAASVFVVVAVVRRIRRNTDSRSMEG